MPNGRLVSGGTIDVNLKDFDYNFEAAIRELLKKLPESANEVMVVLYMDGFGLVDPKIEVDGKVYSILVFGAVESILPQGSIRLLYLF